MARAHGSRRWWRWPLYLVLSLLLLLALLFVALRTSFAREQVRVQANKALSTLFQGKLVIDRVGGLSLWGIEGVDAQVFDASGAQVIRAQGLRTFLSLPGLGWQFISNGKRPQLYIASVHVDHLDVTLREDEELGVTLASTFLPRETSEPTPVSDPSDGPRLRIGRITVDHVWAHGRASGSPPLDAELQRLNASLTQSPVDGFRLDLDRVHLLTRGLPLALDPSGEVSGIVEAPANELGPLRLEVTLDGQAAGSPVALEAGWVGDDVHAGIFMPRLPAAFVNRQAPGLGLEGDVTLAAELDGPLPQLDFRAEIDARAAHVTASGYAVVAQGMELAAAVQASRIDAAGLATGAPTSNLQLQTSVLLLEQDESRFEGAYRLDVEPGRIQTETSPALWLTGHATLDTEVGVHAGGKLGANEAGTALLGNYRVSLPARGEARIALELEARLDDPYRLTALGLHTRGSAFVSAELRPDRGAIEGKASVSLSHVDQQLIQARNVELRANVSGTLDAPSAHAAATLDLLSGRAHADLEYSPGGERLQLFLAEIDLLRLSNVLGIQLPLPGGSFGLDATVTRVAPSAVYALDATAKADLGKLGRLDVVAKQLELPRSAPNLSRLGNLRGELSAKGNVELSEVSPLLTAMGLPIERSGGRVRFEVSARHSADDVRGLELSAQVDTNALRIVEKREAPDEIKTTADAIGNGPHALEGIDLHLAARSWPRSGEAVATLILRDRGGTLAEAQAELQLAGLWPDGLTDAAALSQAPLKMTLEVPERRLQSLPALIRPAALRGRVALDATLEGSVADPQLKARIQLASLRAAGSKAPLDAAADLTYGVAGGSARVDAKMSKTLAPVATLDGQWRGDLRNAARLASGTAGLYASAELELVDFPLDVVPQVVDRQVNGRISGHVKLKDWGKDASLSATLTSNSLVVGTMPIEQLTANAHTQADKLLAQVALRVGSGNSNATLDAGMRWGTRPLPELEHRGVARLSTKAFKLEALSPLLGGSVSELGGVLDANTEVAVTPDSTALSGSASLEHGVVQLPALGQRFSDISARMAVADNQFKLYKLEASGTTGRVSVKGAARLDGFALRGADAQISIAKAEAIPLTVEGSVIGDAWGHINANYASPAQGEQRLDLNIPDFHLITPESGGGSLQSLDANEEIRVGVRRADGKFVPLPVQPLEPDPHESQEGAPAVQPLRVVVKLGNDITVEKGRTAKVQLTGQLTILVAAETAVEGRIEIRGGKLDVSGKTFEIERGVVTFDGKDPGNPTITATARWDAPGYTVYAEYLGDVKNGRIKLHSEPPLTESEIASLLLFGSPEGSPGGNADSNNAALALSVAGDTAAQGLNQVLDDFTNLDVSARVDTTTGSARPELVFQVSPRVSAKVTRAVGAPAIGESPDRTFLTLELRLKRSWALSALFGDRGASALDLIWRRRY